MHEHQLSHMQLHQGDGLAHACLGKFDRSLWVLIGIGAAGRSRGFAFVQFESPEAMHQACEALDGSELHKRQLALRPMESSHQAAAPAEAVPNCWFCLSNEQSDKRLVISVGPPAQALG